MPDMKLQTARACVAGDWEATYGIINPPCNAAVVQEAKKSANPSYLQDLQKKEVEGNTSGVEYDVSWQRHFMLDVYRAHASNASQVTKNNLCVVYDQSGIYDEYRCRMTSVEVHICSSDELLRQGKTVYLVVLFGGKSDEPVLFGNEVIPTTFHPASSRKRK